MFCAYFLLEDSEGLSLMVSIFSEYIIAFGTNLVNRHFQSDDSTASSNNLISSLCNFLSRISNLVGDNCFQSHVLFERSFQVSFKHVLNNPLLSGKMIDFLSMYCNTYLSSSGEKVMDEERQLYLQNAMKLFGYIDDKDYFLQSYRNFLAKRLLFKRSYSNDLERLVIQDLRTSCGRQYTSRLEGMIYDDETADDSFKEGDNGKLYNVRILTKAFWPSAREIPCHIPKEILDFQKDYEGFYSETFSGRKLVWVLRLGSVDMEACFFPYENKTLPKKYLITMNSYQSFVLLRFNKRDSCSFSSLLHETGLPEKELKRILDSFTLHKKFALLQKEEGEEEQYRINESFTNSLKRIKLPFLSFENEKKNTLSEESRVISEVERNFAIDASLVRIMKMRKCLSHIELVEEVNKQITMFRPSMKNIKTRIESLIDREFLLRDCHHMNSYSYIA
jgi:hypothetical protein